MTHDQHLRQELINLLTKKQAHADFQDAVEDFPESHINVIPKGCDYSFWHVVEHLRLCQKDILDYIISNNYILPSFPDDYWPEENAVTDFRGWQQSIDDFLADRDALVKIIQNPEVDLFAPLENSGEHQHSILREINIISAHNAYHTGALVIMRQRAGIWV